MSDTEIELVRFNGFHDGVIQVETGDPSLGMGDLRFNGDPRIGDAVIMISNDGIAMVCTPVAVPGSDVAEALGTG